MYLSKYNASEKTCGEKLKMMRYIQVEQAGDNSRLVMADMPIPQRKAGEFLVKVKAIGVNRADILQRQGKYGPPKGESEILGLEVCGQIVDCDDKSMINRDVFGLVPGGGYAEYCIIRAEHAFVLPPKLSYVDGAALAEVYLTAYQSLFYIGGLKSGELALVHAGASGVGTAAIRLIKACGAYCVVTVGSQEKVEICRQLAADKVINYHEEDYVSEVKHYAQQLGMSGAKVVVDCVAGDYIKRNLDCMTLDSTMVIIAMLGGRFAEKLDMAKMLAKRATIIATTLRNRSDEYKKDLIDCFNRQFHFGDDDGGLLPIIDKVYCWHEADTAHQRILANQNCGKIVLTVS